MRGDLRRNNCAVGESVAERVPSGSDLHLLRPERERRGGFGMEGGGQVLWFLAVLAAWFVLNRWILPKAGIPT
jgi:hypothetical protein